MDILKMYEPKKRQRIECYVDGSFNRKKDIIISSFVILDNPENIERTRIPNIEKLKKYGSTYAELDSIIYLLNFINDNFVLSELKDININFDCLSIQQYIDKTTSKNIELCEWFYSELSKLEKMDKCIKLTHIHSKNNKAHRKELL